MIRDYKCIEYKQPLVSIITAVYNGEQCLEQTIHSVLNQTYPSIEYIVIDGGSKDKTIDIIKKYSSRINYWISEPDKGVFNAWNKGLSKVNGEWVAFVGCGDILVKNAIENYTVFILNNKEKEYDYVSSKIEIVKGDNSEKILRVYGSQWRWSIFKIYMNVAHVGSLHRVDYFKRFGGFDEKYKIAGDYEILLRAGSMLKSGFVNKVTAKMRNDGLSSNNLQVFKETYRAKILTGKRNSLLSFLEMSIAIVKFKIRKLGRRS